MGSHAFSVFLVINIVLYSYYIFILMRTNKFLSYAALIFGVVYFFYETWCHISYDQSPLALTADYISVFLLLFAGIVNLRIKKGIGLLCGAWGYTFCIMYRAFIWRMDAQNLENHETTVLKVLLLTLAVSFPAFVICLIKSIPNKNPN